MLLDIKSIFGVRQNLDNAILSYESSIQLNFKQNGGPSALTEKKLLHKKGLFCVCEQDSVIPVATS